MIGPFEEILSDLGRYFHLELHVDQYGACSILFPPEIVIQLQLDASQENLFLFCTIAEIPPGKFRENILMEGLKANAMRDPLAGVVGFYEETSLLVLSQIYPLFILNGERTAIFLSNFLQMAQSWKSALQSGKTGPERTSFSSDEKPFGLKP